MTWCKFQTGVCVIGNESERTTLSWCEVGELFNEYLSLLFISIAWLSFSWCSRFLAAGRLHNVKNNYQRFWFFSTIKFLERTTINSWSRNYENSTLFSSDDDHEIMGRDLINCSNYCDFIANFSHESKSACNKLKGWNYPSLKSFN